MESRNLSLGNNFQPPSNYDELFMQRSLLFADNLKDLRNIRSQLYSAAEYFEDSYHQNDHDQLLLESLKDYVSNALINTIDHLGSVTYKVNKFLDENVNEAFETKLRVVCIQQRLQTCQKYKDRQGLSQQSLVIETPKYHKHYLVPDGQFSEAVQAEKGKARLSGLRIGHSRQAASELPSLPAAFSFIKAESNNSLEKRSRSRSRSASPLSFPIKRSSFVADQSTSSRSPVRRSGSVIHRTISPNSTSNRQRHPTEAWRSHSLYPEREMSKDIEVYSKKTRNLFKALLSIHKSRTDSRVYRYP